MAKLRRNQRGLHWACEQDSERQGHGRPEHRVHPQQRLKPTFDPEGQSDHDRAEDHDDPDRTGVAGIGSAEPQSANRACRTEG